MVVDLLIVTVYHSVRQKVQKQNTTTVMLHQQLTKPIKFPKTAVILLTEALMFNQSIVTIIVALISSGTLGTIITAMAKKKDRKHIDSVKQIVEDTMGTIRQDVETLKNNQKDMTQKIDNLLVKTQTLNKELEHQKQVSQTCDYHLIKALRKKGVINGDSEVIIELLMKDGNLLLNDNPNGGANDR